jgi:hypothetical protein
LLPRVGDRPPVIGVVTQGPVDVACRVMECHEILLATSWDAV